jgi:hypothetical protein
MTNMRRTGSPLRVIVTGLVAQHPRLGGVAWDYLQYPLGLARLGYDVYYLEDSGEWPYNFDGGPAGNDWVERDPTANVRHLTSVMSRFGLEDRWAYRFAIDGRWFGLSDSKRKEIIRTAGLLLNVSGTLERPEEYRGVQRLAYIDSDPCFTQIKWLQDPAFRRRVDLHDVHFSFGERLSQTAFNLGHAWQPTRQPIVRSEWETSSAPRDTYTTVMSWTSYKPLEHAGTTYGQKDAELLRFLQLPRRVPADLEIALSGAEHIDWQTAGAGPRETIRPRDLLRAHGWRVVDAIDTCSGLDAYRDYVQSSRGEWTPAKQGYVAGRTGWFSCRSACYLAAGRPAVVQDTGFSDILPTGDGVLVFSSLEDAVAAIETVEARYAYHARAAREFAAEYFDSDHVLERLVEQALQPVDSSRVPGVSGAHVGSAQ